MRHALLCAWLLWDMGFFGAGPPAAFVVDAFESKQTCDREAREHTRQEGHTFRCWPVGYDPRDPQG